MNQPAIPDDRPRVCVIGPGWRFTSGISYYTCCLSNALADHAEVSTVLMRRILPRVCYPGRGRVGERLSDLQYDPRVDEFDGIDWFWVPSIFRAVTFLLRRAPNVVVFQWWTGTVAHSYLVLAMLCKFLGARIVIEFHEGQDSGEVRVPLARRYAESALALLVRASSAFLVHSQHDLVELAERYNLPRRNIVVVPHGPFDHHVAERVASDQNISRLLFFGTIRPYKGLEYLIDAFNRLSPDEVRGYRLTVVGETWKDGPNPYA